MVCTPQWYACQPCTRPRNVTRHVLQLVMVLHAHALYLLYKVNKADFSKDAKKDLEGEIQKMLDASVKKVDEVAKSKTDEVMKL